MHTQTHADTLTTAQEKKAQDGDGDEDAWDDSEEGEEEGEVDDPVVEGESGINQNGPEPTETGGEVPRSEAAEHVHESKPEESALVIVDDSQPKESDPAPTPSPAHEPSSAHHLGSLAMLSDFWKHEICDTEFNVFPNSTWRLGVCRCPGKDDLLKRKAEIEEQIKTPLGCHFHISPNIHTLCQQISNARCDFSSEAP